MLCLRGDDARYRHQWRHDHHNCFPHRAHQHEHLSALSSLVSVSSQLLGSNPSCVRHVIPSTCAHDVCGSPSTLISPFSSLFTSRTFLSHSFHFFLLEVRRQPAHSAKREYGLHWRDLLPHTSDGNPLNLHDLEFDDYTSAWRSLHHCSPRSEKMQRAVDKLITLLTKVCCQVNRRPSVMLEQGDLFSDHWFQTSEKIRVATQRMNKSRFFWSDRKSRFSPIVEQRFKTSSRPIMTEEVFKSWMKLSSLKEEKFIVLIKETNDAGEINNFFMNSYWSKFGIFVKLMRKVSMRWKNWTDFKGLHSIQFRGEDWSDTILELTSKIQELQNEIICMNDSRDFQDAESVRSG